MVTFSHTDKGTDEATWAASGLAATAELALGTEELAGMRFVVVAAHPDDETLGAGGLLAQLHSLGADVEVLLCTAGEASHPDSKTVSPAQLGSTRVNEFGAALAALGHTGNWRFLGLPDSGLAGHAEEIAARVREAASLHAGPPEQVVIVAPYRGDGHADHDALGAAAAEVAREGGHALLEYPIWYWLWATPSHSEWESWVRFPLDPGAQAAKAAAMRAHATQVLPLSPRPGDEALLGEDFLRHFHRPFETFAWTPATISAVPHGSADAERIFDGSMRSPKTPGSTPPAGMSAASARLPLPHCRRSTTGAGLRWAVPSGRSRLSLPAAAPTSSPWTPAAPPWSRPPGGWPRSQA